MGPDIWMGPVDAERREMLGLRLTGAQAARLRGSELEPFRAELQCHASATCEGRVPVLIRHSTLTC